MPRARNPILPLLALLGHRWALRVLWELRLGACGFRNLQIACGNISPTVLSTRMRELRKAGLVAGVPLQRAGEPDEIANAIVFLASSKPSFTTGQVLFVDGGKSAT